MDNRYYRSEDVATYILNSQPRWDSIRHRWSDDRSPNPEPAGRTGPRKRYTPKPGGTLGDVTGRWAPHLSLGLRCHKMKLISRLSQI
jgi:hypothetical protein